MERLTHQSFVENETVSFSTLSVINSIPEVHPEPSFSKQSQQERAVRKSVTNSTVYWLKIHWVQKTEGWDASEMESTFSLAKMELFLFGQRQSQNLLQGGRRINLCPK